MTYKGWHAIKHNQPTNQQQIICTYMPSNIPLYHANGVIFIAVTNGPHGASSKPWRDCLDFT